MANAAASLYCSKSFTTELRKTLRMLLDSNQPHYVEIGFNWNQGRLVDNGRKGTSDRE